ncbi:MAG: P2 family phage major capsid protein [Acinetobacter sp.]|nr:P2 family phage major capsid protein [Acinetobacter sp.]
MTMVPIPFQYEFAQIAADNGVLTCQKTFNVTPAIEQSMEQAMKETSDFTDRINTDSQSGDKIERIFADISTGFTKRTDVAAGNERKATAGPITTSLIWEMIEWEHDGLATWAKMEAWAHKRKEFMQLYRMNLARQVIKDRNYIAWRGQECKAHAVTLEEMDTSLLMKLEAENPGSVMNEGVAGHGMVVLGTLAGSTFKNAWANEIAYKIRDEVTTSEGRFVCISDHVSTPTSPLDPLKGEPTLADHTEYWILKPHYPNLDRLIVDVAKNIPEYKKDNMRIFTGSGLISDEKGKLYAAQADTPSEKLKIEQASKSFGGYVADVLPFFQPKSIALTGGGGYKNISWYWQEKTHKRRIEEDHTLKGVADYNRYKGRFVWEDAEAATAVNNIEFLDLDYLESIGGNVNA